MNHPTRQLSRFFLRLVSLVVAEVFVCSSILPAWALQPSDLSTLRPVTVKDGGDRFEDLGRDLDVARDGGDSVLMNERFWYFSIENILRQLSPEDRGALMTYFASGDSYLPTWVGAGRALAANSYLEDRIIALHSEEKDRVETDEEARRFLAENELELRRLATEAILYLNKGSAADGGRQKAEGELPLFLKETGAIYRQLSEHGRRPTLRDLSDGLGIDKGGVQYRLRLLRKLTGKNYPIAREKPIPRSPGTRKPRAYFEQDRLERQVDELINGELERRVKNEGISTELMSVFRFFREVVLEGEGKPAALRHLARKNGYANSQVNEKGRWYLEILMNNGMDLLSSGLRRTAWPLMSEAYEAFGGDPLVVAEIKIKRREVLKRERLTRLNVKATIHLLNRETPGSATLERIAGKLKVRYRSLANWAREQREDPEDPFDIWKAGAVREVVPKTLEQIQRAKREVAENGRTPTTRVVATRVGYRTETRAASLRSRLQRLGTTVKAEGISPDTVVITEDAIDKAIAWLQSDEAKRQERDVTRDEIATHLKVSVGGLRHAVRGLGIDLERKGVVDGRWAAAQRRKKARSDGETESSDGGQRLSNTGSLLDRLRSSFISVGELGRQP